LLNQDKISETNIGTIDSDYSLQHAERIVLKSMLEKFGGHRGKTAQALGIDKSTLWRKMKKYKILK
jgi:transcriptional regulator with PAS, ATPase and Fis domain